MMMKMCQRRWLRKLSRSTSKDERVTFQQNVSPYLQELEATNQWVDEEINNEEEENTQKAYPIALWRGKCDGKGGSK